MAHDGDGEDCFMRADSKLDIEKAIPNQGQSRKTNYPLVKYEYNVMENHHGMNPAPTTSDGQYRRIYNNIAEPDGKAQVKRNKRGRPPGSKNKPRKPASPAEYSSRMSTADHDGEQDDGVEVAAERVVVQMERGKRDEDELPQRKEKRRLRDEEEHYQGLKNFNGSQRGWDGDRKSLRQEPFLQESEGTETTPLKRKKGRPRKIVVETPSPVPKHPHVTSGQLREDMENFRTRMALDVIAIEDAAAESARKQRAYSATIKWDYDWISQGGLRNHSIEEAPVQPRSPPKSFHHGKVRYSSFTGRSKNANCQYY
ncbi:hypothetical protein BKA65DRAFT_25830 [Rhexocercosporidium sp. MPI-PUGE-AT-0058]|nr:hypothetical protein BKA65DRAFT_25830 [Rhexocercosporidium sp. MPI-PUGE-AT-0058]